MTDAGRGHGRGDETLPYIPVAPGDLGLFVLVLVVVGWMSVPLATLERGIGLDVPPTVEILAAWLFAFSPLVAAAVVVGRLDDTGGVRSFLASRFRWRTDLRWYLVALLGLPAVAAVTVGGLWMVDGPLGLEISAIRTPLIEVLAIGLVFAIVENYGWRGFLQEALQSRRSALLAAIAVGIVWGLWHAPLILMPGGPLEAIPFLHYVVLVTGVSVIIGWLYNATGGSVLHAAIMHTSFNATFGIVVLGLVEAGRSVEPMLVGSALSVWVVAAAIGYLTGRPTLR